jgi:hypothetical protein
MATNNNDKITTVVGIIAIVASLIVATMMIIVHHQAYALSKYVVPDDAANGKTNQQLQQEDLGNSAQPPITTPTLPAIPTTNCAMGTIENLESFLSCLGAK